MDEAKVVFAHLCAAYPGFTVAKFRKAMVFSPAAMDRMVASLKKAGLPD
jgi:hypothetical protein